MSLKHQTEGLFNDIEFKELNEPVEFYGCLILEEITSNLEKHLNEDRWLIRRDSGT